MRGVLWLAKFQHDPQNKEIIFLNRQIPLYLGWFLWVMFSKILISKTEFNSKQLARLSLSLCLALENYGYDTYFAVHY
jgi:hypothetical protein